MRRAILYPLSTIHLAALLTGCQTRVYYKSGATLTELRQDWATSRLEARRAELSIHPSQTIFINSGSSAANSYMAGAMVSQSRDARNAAREIAHLTMQAKGYEFIPKKTVPPGESWLKP